MQRNDKLTGQVQGALRSVPIAARSWKHQDALRHQPDARRLHRGGDCFSHLEVGLHVKTITNEPDNPVFRVPSRHMVSQSA